MQHGVVRLVRVLWGILAGICVAAGLRAQTGHEWGVSGFYTVLRTTELESSSRVQLRLRLQLSNAGDDNSSARIVGFESNGLRAQRPASDSEPIELSARRAETAVRDFTLSRKQYDRWLADSRHRLVLEVKSPSGTATQVELAMRRVSGGNEE